MTMTGPDAAHAVAQVDAIDAARALHRSAVDRENHRVALCQRHHFRARLHARPLFRQNELPAREIAPRRRQQDGDLEREHVLAIEILMEAVVVVRAVLQDQRGRPCLSRRVATIEEARMVVGIPGVDAERLVPAICDRREVRIDRCTQLGNERRQRIGEILVFAAPEAMSRHDDARSVKPVIRIPRRKRIAFVR